MKLPGWRKLSSCVFEHADSTRIHLGGLILFPNGERRWVDSWPESMRLNRAIALCGGNRRRGLMFYSRTCLPITTNRQRESAHPLLDGVDDGGAK